jgi:hypothetical protein
MFHIGFKTVEDQNHFPCDFFISQYSIGRIYKQNQKVSISSFQVFIQCVFVEPVGFTAAAFDPVSPNSTPELFLFDGEGNLYRTIDRLEGIFKINHPEGV